MLELKVQFTQGRKASNGDFYLDKNSEIYVHGIKALVLRNMIKHLMVMLVAGNL